MTLNKDQMFFVTASFLLTALACFLGWFSYRYGWQWLDSDYSSELVLGKLLAEENTLVSTNWHYSNELRIIYQTIFTMPLFKLFGYLENWTLIRSINIVLNHIVLILSYIFMMKQFKVNNKWILITSSFLLMPISIEYWKLITYSGIYIFFIAQLFLSLGLFAKLADYTGVSKKILIPLILFSLLSFMHGVQGIRSLMAVYIPLLITCVYLWAGTGQKKRFPLFLGFYGFLLCCAGFAVNNLLNKKYSFISMNIVRTENPTNYWQKIGQSLINVAGFFAPEGGKRFISVYVFLGLIAVIATLFMLIAVIKTVRKARLQKEPLPAGTLQFIPVFFAASASFNIFVFVFSNQPVTLRFFIPFMVLYIPLIALLFEYAEKTYTLKKQMAVIAAVVIFIIAYSGFNFQLISASKTNTKRNIYVQYLLDNRLYFGFATHWNANITTELSNGKIEIACLETRFRSGAAGSPFQISNHLTKNDYSDPYYYHGESFLLLGRGEWEAVRNMMRAYGKQFPDYEDDNFAIVRFPSAEVIHRNFIEK